VRVLEIDAPSALDLVANAKPPDGCAFPRRESNLQFHGSFANR